ncbi:MAG: hypothetical protein ACP5RS_00875 [Thermoplasmata archaeon]
MIKEFVFLYLIVLSAFGMPLQITYMHVFSISATTNSTADIQGMVNRILFIAATLSAGIIALVWIRVGIAFFSSDPNKKIRAKELAMQAMIGSIIIIMAISGIAYALLHYIVVGS